MSACEHPERVDGACPACGDCLHEVVLNGACFACGTTDLDPIAMSNKTLPAELIPAAALLRKRSP